jgi:hypothetical protein
MKAAACSSAKPNVKVLSEQAVVVCNCLTSGVSMPLTTVFFRAVRHLAWLCIALVLAGCGGASSDTPPPTGTVSGLVLSATTGTGLAGVAVSGGGQTATTTSTGAYTLSGVGVGSAVVLKFELSGYAPGYRRVSVAANATSATNARLSAVGATQTIAAAAGGTVGTASGPAQVVLPAAGLVNKASGAAATGQVTVAITAIDPSLDAANMPGDYSARGTDGNAQTIESFGAISVNLSDAAGNRLDLASGQTATVRVPLATRSTTPSATIPLYYFDETAGVWVQQGSATLGGTAPNLYYEGTVSHFTFWNADRPADNIYVHGCVNTALGAPSTDAMVTTDGIDYSGSSSAVTDANGKFTVAMRKGGVANLYADAPGGESNVVVVGPSQVDIYLPACLVLGPPGPPVIVQQPTPVSTQEGAFAQFQVLARGAPPLRFQWLRNTQPLSGAIGSNLLIYPASAADNGAQYAVVVTNDYGSVTSDTVSLTVAALPPGLLSGLQDTAVTAGAAATFAVTTTQPAGLLTFQWSRNGSVIAGATSPSYTTPATTTANNGDVYQVTISNTMGTVTSSAKLSVQALTPPTIIQNPANASVTTGQAASFQVQASGSPPLAYQWQRNGTAISGATGASYTTPATALSDSGASFTVVVSNAAGSVNSVPATLTVADPTFAPTITQQPQNVATFSGQTATFSVTATGTAPLSYQWLRNTVEITGATAASYTTPALSVSDNNTSFTVRVSNAQGSTTSNAAMLTVTAASVAPTIATQPQSQTVVAGLTASFSVTATGTSPLSYQWQRNGTAISGATNASYTTPVLAVADSGAVYAVVVSNTVGSAPSANATLTVTPAQTGTGRYLVAEAGPTTAAAVVYANGSQSIDSRAILAAASVAPTSTAVVEPAGQATELFGQVVAGTVAGGQVTDMHTRYALYFKAGKLYQIDQQVASGTPAGTQLSTLTSAEVCAVGTTPDVSSLIGSDLTDASRSWVFFAAPVSGACASPSASYRAVRMNMGSTDAALSVGEPVATLYDNSAAIVGYIMRNGSSFQRVDANLANPTTLFTMAPSAFKSFGTSFGAAAPGVWLFFNGGQLYAYNLATSASTPTVVATLAAGEQIGAVLSDGSSAYVSIKAGFMSTGFRIVRVQDTLTSATVYSGTSSLTQFALTPTRLVLLTIQSTPLSATSSVTSVLRDGSSPVDLSSTASFNAALVFTGAENVYLYEFGFNSSGVQTGVRTRIVGSDGSNPQTLANTGIIGLIQPISVPLVHTLIRDPYAILLIDNMAADGTSSGGTVHSLVAATRAALLTYGTVQATPPASLFPATIDPSQYGQSGLFAFMPAGTSVGATDLYFLDSATANSLTKVTGFVTLSSRAAPAMVRAPGRRLVTGVTAQTVRQQLTKQPSAAWR